MTNLKKWKVLSTRDLFQTRIFRLRSEECELGDGRVMPSYYTLDFPDWVHVIALDTRGQMVLVRQYRQPVGQFTLEWPGGTTDSREEDPLVAAQRELLEETGYRAGRIELAGTHFPNPALQSNRLFTYVAFDCEKVAEPDLDPFEDIEVETYPPGEVMQMISDGRISHSLIIAGFLRALPLLGLSFP